MIQKPESKYSADYSDPNYCLTKLSFSLNHYLNFFILFFEVFPDSFKIASVIPLNRFEKLFDIIDRKILLQKRKKYGLRGVPS